MFLTRRGSEKVGTQRCGGAERGVGRRGWTLRGAEAEEVPQATLTKLGCGEGPELSYYIEIQFLYLQIAIESSIYLPPRVVVMIKRSYPK